jgi:hypothetical protein
MRTRVIAFGLGAVLFGAPAFADEDVDVEKLTMGLTLPARGLTVGYLPEYVFTDVSDPTQDTVEHQLVVEYGLFERVTIGTGIESADAGRDEFIVDNLLFTAKYGLPAIKRFSFAAAIDIQPAVTERDTQYSLSLESLIDLEPFAVHLLTIGDIEREDGETELGAELLGGIFYRFGLNGFTGLQVEYEVGDKLLLHTSLSGRVSKNVFLSVEPEIGLNAAAPDLAMHFHLSFYVGPYRASNLE